MKYICPNASACRWSNGCPHSVEHDHNYTCTVHCEKSGKIVAAPCIPVPEINFIGGEA